MMNFKNLIVAGLVAGLLSACGPVSADPSAAPGSTPGSRGERNSFGNNTGTGQAEAQKNTDQKITDQKNTDLSGGGKQMISEEVAREKAEAYAAARGWGEATSVAVQGQNYVVFFNTPKRESMLLSQRAVLVNKATGEVADQRRR